MQKIAVIIYGPPGSGKSTQADLVASHYGLIRFDTGKYIESVVFDPKNAKDTMVQEQRKRYTAGLLCDKPWVLGIVTAHLKAIMNAGYGVVLAGSPRTTYEAFDRPGQPGEYSILKNGYGAKNVYTFILNVAPEHSIVRNSSRKICSVCNRQYLSQPDCMLRRCPFCDAPLRSRKDDKPAIIKKRLTEFKKETAPIFARLAAQGYAAHAINGELAPFHVFQKIKKWLP